VGEASKIDRLCVLAPQRRPGRSGDAFQLREPTRDDQLKLGDTFFFPESCAS
jgi:hypothetical protein